MDNTSGNLEGAIVSLLRGESIAEANAFILSFAETESAWQPCTILISSPTTSDPVRFFAANILYTKIRKHWHQLNSEQRDNLFLFLMGVVSSLTGAASEVNNMLTGDRKMFVSRVILSLACVCTRAPGGIASYLQTAFGLVDLTALPNASSTSTSTSTSFLTTGSPLLALSRILLGLDMLTVLPAEIEALDVSRQMRTELEDQLLQASGRVLALADALASSCVVGLTQLAQSQNQFGSSSLSPSPPQSSSSSMNSQYKMLATNVMKLVRAWLLQGVTLSKLCEEHAPIMQLTSYSMQSGDGDLVRQACGLLKEVTGISDFPRGEARNRAVNAVVQLVTSSATALAPFFGPDGDNDVAHEVCDFIVTLATSEVSYLSSPQGFNVDIFQLLLSCVSLRPRKISSLTFDIWVTLQDMPVSERHPFLVQDIFYKLLPLLMDQCLYPEGFSHWDPCSYDEDDMQDLESFREHKNGIQEVVLICFHALRGSFFATIMETIISQSDPNPIPHSNTNPNANPNVLTPPSNGLNGAISNVEGGGIGGMGGGYDWRKIELGVYMIHIVMDAIKTMITTASESSADCLQFLYQLVQYLLGIPTTLTMHYPQMRNGICKFFGSLTFLVSPSPDTETAIQQRAPHMIPLFQDLFMPILQFVFPAINDDVCSPAAARTFYQFCVHGMQNRKSLLLSPRNDGQQPPVICELIEGAVHLMTQQVVPDGKPYLTLIESLVRGIVQLQPPTFAREQLLRLGGCMIEGLQCQQLQQPLQQPLQSLQPPPHTQRTNDTSMHILKWLSLSSQLIRFCDVPIHDNTGNHILVDFLSALWPQLQSIESNTSLMCNVSVIEAIFDVYGRSLNAAGVLLFPHIPRMTQSIVNVFQSKSPGTPAALQCAAVIVEILSGSGNTEAEPFLSQLLEAVTQILFDAAKNAPDSNSCGCGSGSGSGNSGLCVGGGMSSSSMSSGASNKLSMAMLMSTGDNIHANGDDDTPPSIWGYDPDSIEKYFYFLNKYLIFSPHLVSTSSRLPHIVYVAVRTLHSCKERAPIRAVLTVLQCFLYPVSKKLQVVHDNLFVSVFLHGQDIVSQILLALDTGLSNPLWPNFTDTLYFLILGCEERGKGNESRQWVHNVMMQTDVMSRLSLQVKERVVMAMFQFAPTIQRKFKALMQDVSKVCAGEQAEDCFLVYFDST